MKDKNIKKFFIIFIPIISIIVLANLLTLLFITDDSVPIYIGMAMIVLTIVFFELLLISSNKKNTKNKRKRYSFNPALFSIFGIPVFIILFGVLILFLGIFHEDNLENYKSTKGYFVKIDNISSNEKIYTYLYKYKVNNKEYFVTVDDTTGIIPKTGEKKTIAYNKYNPNKAYVKDDSDPTRMVFIILGIFFIIIPSIPIIGMLSKKH